MIKERIGKILLWSGVIILFLSIFTALTGWIGGALNEHATIVNVQMSREMINTLGILGMGGTIYGLLIAAVGALLLALD